MLAEGPVQVTPLESREPLMVIDEYVPVKDEIKFFQLVHWLLEFEREPLLKFSEKDT